MAREGKNVINEMQLVDHNGTPTLANSCNKGYRCTKCGSTDHKVLGTPVREKK